MKKIWWLSFIIVVLVVAGGLYYFVNSRETPRDALYDLIYERDCMTKTGNNEKMCVEKTNCAVDAVYYFLNEEEIKEMEDKFKESKNKKEFLDGFIGLMLTPYELEELDQKIGKCMG